MTNHQPQRIRFAKNPVVAHRGAFKYEKHPENSIAALKEAIRLQCTGSEFDVRVTADDSLVIHHDPTFHQVAIEKARYHELSALSQANGEKLPTLRQYLLAGLVNNNHTRLILEIKPSTVSKERGKLVATRGVQLVQELNAGPRTVYICFDYDILKKIVEIIPEAPAQYLSGDRRPKQLKADGISGADYHISVYRKHPEWIEDACSSHIALNAWTVNEAEDMQWLLFNKVDFITTDEPERLLSLWKSISESGN